MGSPKIESAVIVNPVEVLGWVAHSYGGMAESEVIVVASTASYQAYKRAVGESVVSLCRHSTEKKCDKNYYCPK